MCRWPRRYYFAHAANFDACWAPCQALAGCRAVQYDPRGTQCLRFGDAIGDRLPDYVGPDSARGHGFSEPSSGPDPGGSGGAVLRAVWVSPPVAFWAGFLAFLNLFF